MVSPLHAAMATAVCKIDLDRTSSPHLVHIFLHNESLMLSMAIKHTPFASRMRSKVRFTISITPGHHNQAKNDKIVMLVLLIKRIEAGMNVNNWMIFVVVMYIYKRLNLL